MKILGVIVALALGALGGAMVIHGRLAPEVAQLTGQIQALNTEKARVEEQLRAVQSRALSLEKEFAAQGQPVASVIEGAPEPETPAEEVLEEADDEGAMGAAAPQLRPKNLRKRAERADVVGAPQGAEETRQDAGRPSSEERAERMRSFENQMRDQADSFLQQEYANATDAETQQRIELLQQYAAEMMELRTQMREAQTDEERDAIRQSMWESHMNARDVLQVQQASMLRTFASNNGITEPDKQEAFVAGLRDLQATPIFQADRVMMMGGGPGRGDRPPQ